MNVSVVVTCWNGRKLLEKNLPSVIKASKYSKNRIQEIIVVDDGSTDDSVLFLKEKYPDIRVVKHKKNIGYSATCNTGVSEAKNELVVIFNADVVPEENFLESALPYFEDEKVFAVSFNEGKYGAGKIAWKNGFLEIIPNAISKKVEEGSWASGGSSIFRKSIWEKLGGMDKLYLPFYFEDVDLGLRAKKEGFKCLWDPNSTVIHQHEGTINENNFQIKYINLIKQRNHLLLTWKNINSFSLLTSHVKNLFKKIIKAPGYLKVVFSALKKKFYLSQKTFLFLLVALIIRLILAPLWHHSDADSIYSWSKYLWETKNYYHFIGTAIPDASVANYPPIFYLIFSLWRGLYEIFGRFLWFINQTIHFFPSSIIWWYQGHYAGVAFNKLVSILADFGCAYFIYKIARILGGKEKQAKLSATLFLFLPPFLYNSAYWGQVESLYSVFVLLAFYLSLKSKYILGILFLAISALIKATGLFVFPALIIFVFKKKKYLELILGAIFSILLGFIVYFPFRPESTIPWAINFYLNSFRGELDYIVSNAFNLWGFIFGFDPVSSNTMFGGISLSNWAFIVFAPFFALIMWRLWKSFSPQVLIKAAFLLGFAAFLFLPRMHERYLYTSLIFLGALGGLNKKWTYGFIFLSLTHLINLYHLWWYPKIPLLINIFSNLFVLRLIIISTMIYFFYNLYFYLKGNENFDNNS